MPKVRFLAHGRSWEAEVPVGSSVLKASKTVGAPEGDACGGVCACSTCHVHVLKGRDLLRPAEEDEEDILDKAFDVRPSSRLGCQATIEKDGEIEVEITRESLDAYYNEHPNVPDPRKQR
ncbi:MAG: 2Fe-2S iron-sulfur cluster binding domain-containing protein [Polyangiaceae bacterium]|nr:2Fe-2S iron-sulfur cluster binding domain-containing protein [Polyangiaceae bacterium]